MSHSSIDKLKNVVSSPWLESILEQGTPRRFGWNCGASIVIFACYAGAYSSSWAYLIELVLTTQMFRLSHQIPCIHDLSLDCVLSVAHKVSVLVHASLFLTFHALPTLQHEVSKTFIPVCAPENNCKKAWRFDVRHHFHFHLCSISWECLKVCAMKALRYFHQRNFKQNNVPDRVTSATFPKKAEISKKTGWLFWLICKSVVDLF